MNTDDVKVPRILHFPLYLNVSMMSSFLASVEDGYSEEASAKTSASQSTKDSRQGELGLGLTAAIFKLADIRGKFGRDHDGSTAEEVQMVRKHTEGSLFNKLYQLLEQDITAVTGLKDIQQLEPGSIVEVKGAITISPVQEILQIITSAISLLNATAPPVEPIKQQQHGARKGHGGAIHQAVQKGGPALISAKWAAWDSQLEQWQAELRQVMDGEIGALIRRIAERIQQDTEASTMIDMLLKSPSGDLIGVITLPRESAPTSVLESMLGAHLTVLGKVTQCVPAGGTISFLRRTSLSSVPTDAVDAVIQQFASISTEFARYLRIDELTVRGPCLQILPLAIYT